MNTFIAFAYRCAFVLAFLVAAVAVLQAVSRTFGYTLLGGFYSGGRLLEFAGILMIFVIAILLRDIRDLAREKRG